MVDKYEYKIKFEQIKALSAEGDYEGAAEIADTIQWRKVKNINLLIKAGDVYSKLKRYDDAKDILQMAYDRSPIGRMIIYRLAEIAIKTKNFEDAEEYYDEFVEIAPRDNLKYVLRYKISKAKGADLQSRINILEELNEAEYTEEWAFELAYLYHRAGENEKCIDACDKLILWFGEGVYVERAMELKMLYQPLTKTQEDKYRIFKRSKDGVKEVYPKEDVAHIAPESESTESSKSPPKNIQPAGAEGIRPEGGMNGWERTSRATQEALRMAKQQKLEAGKAKALQEAEDIMDRLVDVIPKLDAGIAPNQLLREKYLSESSISTEERAGRYMAGMNDMLQQQIDRFQEEENTEPELLRKIKQAKPNFEGRVGVRPFIPRSSGRVFSAEAYEEQPLPEGYAGAGEAEQDAAMRAEEAFVYAGADETESTQVVPGEPEDGIVGADETDSGSVMPEDPEPDFVGSNETDSVAAEPEETVSDFVTPEEAAEGFAKQKAVLLEEMAREFAGQEVVLPGEAAVELAEELPYDEEEIRVQPDFSESEIPEGSAEEMRAAEAEFYGIPIEALPLEPSGQIPLPEPDLQSDLLAGQDTKEIKAKIIAEALDKQAEEIVVEDEQTTLPPEHPAEPAVNIITLDEEQKAIFSYFVPVAGMESQICRVLTNTIARFAEDESPAERNILIQGPAGCGKTILAKRLVKALQKELKRPDFKLGKIDAEKLNEKDLSELMKKMAGGCLLIERAEGISRETAVRLSLLLENDISGILLIMEDTRVGLEEALKKDEGFARKFTEKIKIPVFTIDELVEFGRVYAHERDYEIDNMGELALYKRISSIQRLDRPTTLLEVKDIIDEAIGNAEKKSWKKAFSILTSRRYTEDDYIILREKDFEE